MAAIKRARSILAAMIRVLHIIPDFGIGGAERMAVHLMCHTDRSTYEVAAVSLFRNYCNELTAMLEAAGIRVFYLGKRLGFDVRMFGRLDSALRTYRPDVVHSHRYALPYALPAILRQRVRAKVHTLHNVATREAAGVQRLVQQCAFRSGVAPVAIADGVAHTIRDVYGLVPRACIPNGIPLSAYQRTQTDARRWRHQLGFSNDDVLIVSIARLSPQKNTDLLIRAYAEGLSRCASTRLLLVGDGPLRQELEQTARELLPNGRVHFLGCRDDVADVLAAADIFALSSDWEGNPLSVMEAMAAGKPVIATAVGGVPELVVHERTGLLVDPNNTRMLANALTMLAKNADTRGVMGARASAFAQSHFSAATMARRYERLYEELLGCKPRRPSTLHG